MKLYAHYQSNVMPEYHISNSSMLLYYDHKLFTSHLHKDNTVGTDEACWGDPWNERKNPIIPVFNRKRETMRIGECNTLWYYIFIREEDQLSFCNDIREVGRFLELNNSRAWYILFSHSTLKNVIINHSTKVNL